MGTVTDLNSRRRQTPPAKREACNSRFVVCHHCTERHPIVRLANGTERCFTAFIDGDRWFCQNRGCRAAFLSAEKG